MPASGWAVNDSAVPAALALELRRKVVPLVMEAMVAASAFKVRPVAVAVAATLSTNVVALVTEATVAPAGIPAPVIG